MMPSVKSRSQVLFDIKSRVDGVVESREVPEEIGKEKPRSINIVMNQLLLLVEFLLFSTNMFEETKILNQVIKHCISSEYW